MDYIDTIEQKLVKAIEKAVAMLNDARPDSLPGDPAARLEEIAAQVSQPCIVAVVGQVKAGKSSFINALLRDDLAKVGTSETTATINYFRYSQSPLTPDRTVRCFYRDKSSAYVDRAFLDSLQGNDIGTLYRAAEIDHLEYYLHNPKLKQITLVDTPGTGAAIDEHQNVTAEFMRLHKQLRERHDKETRELSDTADAVIYLIGAVASSADQRFLKEFHELTKGLSKAFNAVGVMSKVDLYPETIERRAELCAKIADQLKEELNTVVPVSAGIRRALDVLLTNNRAGLKRLVEAVRSIQPGKFDRFFFNPNLYLRADPDWPLSIEQRKELRSNMEWRVFAAIARIAADPDLDLEAIGKQLNAIAGFDLLRDCLEQHIFQRSRLLRCFCKVNQARQILRNLHYLPASDRQDYRGKEKLEQYCRFIQQASVVGGDPTSAQELEILVKKSLASQAEPLDTIVNELSRPLADIFHKLAEYNEDFGTFQIALRHNSLFSPAEMDELQALLGEHRQESEDPLSVEYVKERQRAWRRINVFDQDSLRRDVAARAVARYGLIQAEMSVAK